MKGKVLRPIPGTGYSVGDTASFTEKGVAKYAEYLENKEYFEVSKEPVKAEKEPEKEPEPVKKKIDEDDEPKPIKKKA